MIRNLNILVIFTLLIADTKSGACVGQGTSVRDEVLIVSVFQRVAGQDCCEH